MALVAEVNHAQFVEQDEIYGQSLSVPRRLGYLAVEVPGSPEIEHVQELAFGDFDTAVAEMLKTDKEFGEISDVDNERTHNVVDDKTVATDGTPMVEMLKIGAEKSKKDAEKDPAYKSQAGRDACDIEVVEKVDKLLPGQTWIGISYKPRKAIREYPEVYKGKFGYSEEIIYIQIYSKVDDHTLVAGSYSINEDNETIWREILTEVVDMEIPEDASDDEWLKYGQTIEASPEEAKALALKLRTEFYERTGKKGERQSTTEYVKQNRSLVRQLFDIYYPDLAEAIYTGQNNPTLQGLARSLLSQNIDNLKTEVRQQLIHSANSTKFDDKAGRMFNSVIRYAVVEELRKGLKQFIKRSDFNTPVPPIYYTQGRPLTAQEAHYMLAGNVQAGILAGRSYGGCPGQIELSDLLNGIPGLEDGPSKQEAFGGADADMKCVKCPFCKKTVDAIVTTSHISCPECKASVER